MVVDEHITPLETRKDDLVKQVEKHVYYIRTCRIVHTIKYLPSRVNIFIVHWFNNKTLQPVFITFFFLFLNICTIFVNATYPFNFFLKIVKLFLADLLGDVCLMILPFYFIKNKILNLSNFFVLPVVCCFSVTVKQLQGFNWFSAGGKK